MYDLYSYTLQKNRSSKKVRRLLCRKRKNCLQLCLPPTFILPPTSSFLQPYDTPQRSNLTHMGAGIYPPDASDTKPADGQGAAELCELGLLPVDGISNLEGSEVR